MYAVHLNVLTVILALLMMLGAGFLIAGLWKWVRKPRHAEPETHGDDGGRPVPGP